MKRSIVFILGLILMSSMAVLAQDAVPTRSVNTSTNNYLIKPGDKLVGKVMGEEAFNFEVIIDENGKFELPFFDDTQIVAKCRTQSDVKSEVKRHYSKFLRNPLLSVQVTERRKPIPVTISGEVNKLAQVELTREARLLEMLTVAGGERESAGGIVRVFRTRVPDCASPEDRKEWMAQSENEKILPSRMYSLSNVKAGTKEANPIIYPGDIIVVEKASPVYFVGQIGKAEGLYIKEGGLSLSQAIAMVGGTLPKAKKKEIKIYRLKGSGPTDRKEILVNLEAIKDGKADDIMLEPYDIIDIERKKKSMAQTVLEVVTGIGRSAATSLGTGGVGRILY